jgi:hypothetical protein
MRSDSDTSATVGTESPAARERECAGARETDLDFAARRLAAVYEQLSQAGRVIAEARALRDAPVRMKRRPDDGALVIAADALDEALADYDHAAARAAALNEGSTG